MLPVLLWGPLSVGAPVRPNMLNMPKSASGQSINRRRRRRPTVGGGAPDSLQAGLDDPPEDWPAAIPSDAAAEITLEPNSREALFWFVLREAATADRL